MTYDDCEAYEAAQAEERAARLYGRYQALRDDVLALDAYDRAGLLARLEAVASALRLAEEDLMAGVEVKTAPIYRELGEIRRVAQATSMRASTLEGTGDVSRSTA